MSRIFLQQDAPFSIPFRKTNPPAGWGARGGKGGKKREKKADEKKSDEKLDKKDDEKK